MAGGGWSQGLRAWWRWLWPWLLGLLLLVPLTLPSAVLAANNPQNADRVAAASASETLLVSLRLANIHGFSTKDKSYTAEGTLWLTYGERLRQRLEQKELTPLDLVGFYNLIQPWNSRLTPLTGEPESLTDGRYRLGYDFGGVFYANQIDYSAYPFGWITLYVTVQPRPNDLTQARDPLKIVLKPGDVEIGSRVGIDGYQLQSWDFETVASSRPSQFDSHAGAGGDRLEFRLLYSVNIWAALVKWVLPLAVVMLVVLITPEMGHHLAAERLAIPPVVLLTIVFMQQSYRETLPVLPYLTFLDGLYAYSYLVNLVLFVQFIWAANLMKNAPDAGRAALGRRVDRRDRRLQLILIGGYGLLVLAWVVRALAS